MSTGNKIEELNFIDNEELSIEMKKNMFSRWRIIRYIRKNEVLVQEGPFGRVAVRSGFSFHSMIAAERHMIYTRPVVLNFPETVLPTSDDINVTVDMDLQVKVIDAKTYYEACSLSEKAITAEILTKTREWLIDIVRRYSFDQWRNVPLSGSATSFNIEAIKNELKAKYGYFNKYGIEVDVNSFNPPLPPKSIIEAAERKKTQVIENQRLKDEADAANERKKAEAKTSEEIAENEKRKHIILAEGDVQALELRIAKIKALHLDPDVEATLINTLLMATSGSKVVMVSDSQNLGSSRRTR